MYKISYKVLLLNQPNSHPTVRESDSWQGINQIAKNFLKKKILEGRKDAKAIVMDGDLVRTFGIREGKVSRMS